METTDYAIELNVFLLMRLWINKVSQPLHCYDIKFVIRCKHAIIINAKNSIVYINNTDKADNDNNYKSRTQLNRTFTMSDKVNDSFLFGLLQQYSK